MEISDTSSRSIDVIVLLEKIEKLERANRSLNQHLAKMTANCEKAEKRTRDQQQVIIQLRRNLAEDRSKGFVK